MRINWVICLEKKSFIFDVLRFRRKSKKKSSILDELETVKSPHQDQESMSLDDTLELKPRAEPDSDEWSDTPLSALKDEPKEEDIKPTIPSTPIESNLSESLACANDTLVSEPTPVKMEEGSDIPEDETAKPAQNTSQTKTKRKSKSNRSTKSK